MHARNNKLHPIQMIPSGRLEGADLGRSIAEVRETLDSLEQRLEILSSICATRNLGDRFVIDEGPFVGDAPAALETTRLWLERSRLMLASPARSLAQAHVAAGSLASRGRSHPPTRHQ